MKSITNKSRLDRYLLKWETCKKCPLCRNRTNVVNYRGAVPADILFIGDAPGISEDILGIPFCGSAGKFLDLIIKEAEEVLETRLKYCITNIVACNPPNNREPKKLEVKKCSPRLKRIIKMVNPKLVVPVGAVATKAILKIELINNSLKNIEKLPLLHPRFLLRLSEQERIFEFRRQCCKLINAMKAKDGPQKINQYI